MSVCIRNFFAELVALSTSLVPEMLALLRNNTVANPEKLLIELIDEQISAQDAGARNQSANRSSKKLNKVSVLRSVESQLLASE